MSKYSKKNALIYCKNLDINVIKISGKRVIAKCDLGIIHVLKTSHSPGGARTQYFSNRLNPIFAFSTFKNTIPTLNRYTQVNVGTSIKNHRNYLTHKTNCKIWYVKLILSKNANKKKQLLVD